MFGGFCRSGHIPSAKGVHRDAKVDCGSVSLICFDQIVVDTKTIDNIGDHEMSKMLNYLRPAVSQAGRVSGITPADIAILMFHPKPATN